MDSKSKKESSVHCTMTEGEPSLVESDLDIYADILPPLSELSACPELSVSPELSIYRVKMTMDPCLHLQPLSPGLGSST